jgi:hypothetical protein
MIIFDPATKEIVVNQNVCISGSLFNISVSPGIYNIYYRPYMGGAQSFEVFDLDLTSDLDTTFVIMPYVDNGYITNSEFSQLAVFGEGADDFFITAEIDNSFSIDSMFWYREFLNVTNGTIEIAKIELFDNGIGNDLIANDNIFASENVFIGSGTYVRSNALSSGRANYFSVFEGPNYFGSKYSAGAVIGNVNPSATTIQPLEPYNDSVFINDYLINIVGDLSQTNDNISMLLYDVMLDTFDFINLFIPELGSGTNYHIGVANDVSGIGQNVFDNTSNYGSSGKLKGLSVFPNISYQPPLNHETMHQWSNYFNTLFNSNNFGSHFGHSSVYGVLGGIGPDVSIINANTVSYQNDISYGFSSDTRLFADLELYQMGVLDTNELRDTFIVVTNPVPQGNSIYTVSTLDIVTPQDIVNTYGYRLPNPTDTVPIYRTATIILTSEVLSDAGNMFYTYLAKAWEGTISEVPFKSFDEATGYRTDMITLLPSAIKGCTNSQAHNYQQLADIDDGSCETCTDNILNGDEVQIDCGGSFCNLCTILGHDCPTVLNLDGISIVEGLYKADVQVISNNVISGNITTKYEGGNSILLSPQFEVNLGSIFEVEILPCIPE